MINEHQALTAVREANPAIDEQSLPDVVWSTSDLLREVARRTDMQTHQPVELTSTEQSPPPKRSRGPLLALATAAVVLLIGAVFVVASLGGDTVEPEPATSLPPVTSVAPSTTALDVEQGAAVLNGRVWTVVDGISFSRPSRIEFSADGGYSVFDAGLLVNSGQSTFNGDIVTFESAPTDEVTWVFNDADIRVTDSCEGVIGEYEVIFADAARVILDVVSDGCRTRVGVANGLQLEPVQP